MTTPWDHDSKNLNPTDQCSPLVQRKKLQVREVRPRVDFPRVLSRDTFCVQRVYRN